ncbi:MAG: hypothetical protein IKY61_08260, partial [Thermoguttaceae bacterium]|nr:hypothetical protein [Thermoguttaceae bacterium]
LPFGLIFPLIGAAVCLAEVGYALKLSFQTDRAVFSTEPPTADVPFDPSAPLRCPDCESGAAHDHSQHARSSDLHVHADACDHPSAVESQTKPAVDAE